MPKGPTSQRHSQLAKIHWAPRLPPRLLQRLYQADAMGLRDLELCDNVGFRLHERCRTFVLVSTGEVECPLCSQVFGISLTGQSRCSGQACDWSTTNHSYRESVRNHYAHTGRAIGAFAAFYRQYPAAKSYTDKILLIDQLVHSFHVEEATQTPVKSIASKLLAGNKTDVVRFLDQLSAVDPAEKDRWRRSLSQTIHGRLLNPAPDQE